MFINLAEFNNMIERIAVNKIFKLENRDASMKNDECVIYFITKHGSTQVYKRDKKGWTQKSSRGIVRRMTAEQFLSHLLPGLTHAYKNKLTIKVIRKLKKRKK